MKESSVTKVAVSLPQTTYAVALLYKFPGVNRHQLFCRMFVVNGEDPLTADEVKTRAVKLVEGDSDGYEFLIATYVYSVMKTESP